MADSDAAARRDATLQQSDLGGGARDGGGLEAGSDAGSADSARDGAVADASCSCPTGQVYRRSSCVPTLELGCGPTCNPADPSGCRSGRRCDKCAASVSCATSSCRPACVPEPVIRPLVGPLRLVQTSGAAGQPTALSIEGAQLYVGALFYRARINGSQLTGYVQVGAKPCSARVTFTPSRPGVYTVEISQYGGAGPWVLAGFYTATAGAPAPDRSQPGFPCGSASRCVQGPGYSCSCVTGRCRC